jgi:selenocysteine lyase/cysteine desulfurase
MVSRGSVVWEEAPDRFEAGTPAVINAIALAKALQIRRRAGAEVFMRREAGSFTAAQVLGGDDFPGLSGRELLRELRLAVVGRGRLVPTDAGLAPFVGLDNAASTPALRPVWEAFRKTLRLREDEEPALVSRVKDLGARFFGAPRPRYELVFTSNTTEAINLAVRSLENSPADGRAPVVVNTLLEHNSNELPWRFAKGIALLRLPIDASGFPDLPAFERLLREYNLTPGPGRSRIRLVALSGASNVLGTCPDLKAVSRIAHRYGAAVLVDAAQLAGHRKIEMEADGIDLLAFSGHKMYAPFGAGGLVVRKGFLPTSGREIGEVRASGEENAAGIAALGKAFELLDRVGMETVRADERELVRLALRELSAVPGLEIYGINDPESARLEERVGVVSFGLRRVPHNLVAEELAAKGGIGVRSGCFCAHLLVKRLLRIHPAREALANLGLKLLPRLTKSLLPGLVRASFGIENDARDVLRLAGALKAISTERVSFRDRLLARTHNATPCLPEGGVREKLEACAESSAARVFGPDAAGGRSGPEETRAHAVKAPLAGSVSPRRACCFRH